MSRETGGILLACDVDDTQLAVDSHSAGERRASAQSLGELCAYIKQARATNQRPLYFGSATGRNLASHKERERQSPAFAAAALMMDFTITAVGSEIHLMQPGKRPSKLSGWPQAPGWNRKRVEGALTERPELTMQPSAAQGEHKVSFDVRGISDNDHEGYVADITGQLAEHRIKAQVLFSGGMFLDILPPGVNKGTALLRTAKAVASSHDHAGHLPLTIAAGDSMNDRDMLQAADRAILPANAHDSLKRWARSNIASQKLYIARGNFAAGVLEGYRHFTESR